jgi:hypothetical protein
MDKGLLPLGPHLGYLADHGRPGTGGNRHDQDFWDSKGAAEVVYLYIAANAHDKLSLVLYCDY